MYLEEVSQMKFLVMQVLESVFRILGCPTEKACFYPRSASPICNSWTSNEVLHIMLASTTARIDYMSYISRFLEFLGQFFVSLNLSRCAVLSSDLGDRFAKVSIALLSFIIFKASYSYIHSSALWNRCTLWHALIAFIAETHLHVNHCNKFTFIDIG